MTKFSNEFKESAKQELLALAETASKEAVKSVFKICELAIKDTDNKFDDMILPVLPKLQEVVLGYVEEIKK